jgi:hypothetical protein
MSERGKWVMADAPIAVFAIRSTPSDRSRHYISCRRSQRDKPFPEIGFARRVGPAFDPRGNLTVIVGFRQRRTPMKLPARDIKIPPISTKTLNPALPEREKHSTD